MSPSGCGLQANTQIHTFAFINLNQVDSADLSDFDKYLPLIRKIFPDYRFSWEIFTDLILENVARKPLWLDIGAGQNLLIKEQPGAKFALGVDIVKPRKVHIDSKSAYCLASAYNLPLKADTFDFITSRYMFEHLQNPEAVIAEVGRILKPDGIFAMQTTNINNPLVFLANLIPFPIKKLIIKRLFQDNLSGTFKTYYRINKPSSIKAEYGIPEDETPPDRSNARWALVLKNLIMVEDVICRSRLLFTISFQVYKLVTMLCPQKLSGNMIAVFQKEKRVKLPTGRRDVS